MLLKNERALSRELMHRLAVDGIFSWLVEKGHGGTDGAPDMNVSLPGLCAIMPTELKFGAIRKVGDARNLIMDGVQPAQVDFHVAAAKSGVHTRVATYVPVTNELVIVRGISILNWKRGIPDEYWLASANMPLLKGATFRGLLGLGL